MSLLGPFSDRILRESQLADVYFRKTDSGFVYIKLDNSKSKVCTVCITSTAFRVRVICASG